MSRERDGDEAGEELAPGAGDAAERDLLEAGAAAEVEAAEGAGDRRLARSMAAAIERHAARARDAEGAEEPGEGAEGSDEEGETPATAASAIAAAAGAGSAEDAASSAEASEEPAGDGEGAAAAELPPLGAVLEAVLFAAAEPVPLGRLARLLASWPRAAVVEALADFAEALVAGQRGVRLVETASGYQLRSALEAASWVRRFFTDKPPRLSRPMLETVAIVAYRQPVTRGEIESIRGVNCDAVLGALVTRGLVRVAGRRQSPGRPVEYGTTADFLDLFSLRDLSELPPLPDPAALASLIDEDAEEAEANGEAAGGDEELGEDQGAAGEAAEDPEPGGARVAPGGGGLDPGGPGAGEREGGAGARDEGGPDPGSDHH